MQFTQTYQQPSQSKVDEKGMHFELSPEISRPPVSLNALIHSSLSYARIMLALRDVVTGNWRAPFRDYSNYQEWVHQQYLRELPDHFGEIAEKKLRILQKRTNLEKELKLHQANIAPLKPELRTARSLYYQWLYKHDREKWIVLDPVISVHPDAVIFEAFSLDESAYGRVSVPTEKLESFQKTQYGTTNIDFSEALANELYRVRSYRPAWLKVAYEQVELSTSSGASVEKKIDLPESWVRGFLQVQSAASLPGTNVRFSASLLSEMLSILEQKKTKVSPRSLRIHLKKGENPRLELDPWGIQFQEQEFVYEGEMEGEIRLWGRRRLLVLKSLLPYADVVELKLLGSGMPSYWSVELNGHRFDLGLSGWTTNDWAKKGNFDLLASTSSIQTEDLAKVQAELIKQLSAKPQEIAQTLSLSVDVVTSALQTLCKNGQAMYDHLRGSYRWRKLLEQEIKWESSEEDERLKQAVRLVKDKKVKLIQSEKEGKLNTYKFEVTVEKSFQTSLKLNAEGRIQYAECSCGFYRHNKLRKGPCAHIMAGAISLDQ